MGKDLASAFYAKGKVVLLEPLGTTTRLGSIGYFSNGQWAEVGTTETFFSLKLRQAPGTTDPNSFDAKGGKKLTFNAFAKGETSALVSELAKASARAEISFGSNDAFILSVKNQTVRTTQELAELMAAIRWAYHFREKLPARQAWEKNYAVVVGLASATSVAALSSTSTSATAIVTGSAAGAPPSSIGDIDASMKVSFSKESVDQLWRAPARGYAIQALRIKPGFFRRWDHEDVSYLETQDIAFSGTRRRSVPTRPQSYVAWARTQKLTFGQATAQRLKAAEPRTKRARAKKRS